MLDVHDISNGTELHPIPLFCPVGGPCPMPAFTYVTKNIISPRVIINHASERSCTCSGRNCLDSRGVCECAAKNGGQFAYRRDGRLAPFMLQRVSWLTNISYVCYPFKILFPIGSSYRHVSALQVEPQMVFCDQGQGCYLTGLPGRGRAGDQKECYGHIPRVFISECNCTCPCGIDCGNRVVQRGMKVKLGVFWTGLKGWGVRTFEAIPSGTFLFEYVGEVCSNAELITRDNQPPFHGIYTLDLNADWRTEAAVTDTEALCIEGMSYGNVARFVNHRCEDANLIDFPVRIESADPHIYHVAFFAKRPIYALEELTWVITLLSHPIPYLIISSCMSAFETYCGMLC